VEGRQMALLEGEGLRGIYESLKQIVYVIKPDVSMSCEIYQMEKSRTQAIEDREKWHRITEFRDRNHVQKPKT
jgi:hypothetical protein